MYLAIEGVIGVGKTSLARLLQREFEAQLMLEAFDENPFLSDFYDDRQLYAFQTQIFFLLSRYRQQHELTAIASPAPPLIADYTFEKDALFARLNLTGDELATYQLVHDALAERVLFPDLVVYLRVDTPVAMRRIAQRDRPYERNMDQAYIDQVNQAYEQHFSQWTRHRVLTIDSNELDFVSRPDDFDWIANSIRSALGIPPYQPPLPLQGEATA